jgi:hypothetical protein
MDAEQMAREMAKLREERDALERDMDLLFGPGWGETLNAVAGKPHDFAHAQVTRLTCDLLVMRGCLRKLVDKMQPVCVGNMTYCDGCETRIEKCGVKTPHAVDCPVAEALALLGAKP